MKNLSGNATRWLRYALVALCCLSGAAVGNPVGGTVVAGTASITTSGTTMTVQNSPGAVINWTDFSIGAGETVNFAQPSSASTVLLRVGGTNPSQILGQLQSNGRVFIIAPAGMLFGASAAVDAGGLVASTLDLTDQNFMANRLQFSSGAGQGTIVNAGAITAASGGSVYLVSPDINNTGVISAAQGDILLAAGTSVDLTTLANPVVADAGGAPVSTVNSGQLLAQNGNIRISAAGSVNLNGPVYTGNLIVDSTGTITGTLANAGAVTFGEAVITGTLTNTGAVTLTTGGTLTNAGAINLTSGALTNTGAVTVIANTLANAGALTLATGGTLTNAGALTLTGTDTLANAGSFIVAASTGAVSSNAGVVLSPNAIGLAAGWNLIGNSTDASLDVATAFGDASKVATVWKWNPATSKWAFYSPSLIGQALTDYAAGKGLDVLTTINSGEGFWVNAKTPFAFVLPIGNLLPTSTFQTTLTPGWNMVSIGENQTPGQFNTALSLTQPATGTTPINLTSLWAWDNAQSSWYFYAPSLETNGGLASYIATKGWLDFTATNKVLGPGMGFWVNRP